MFSKAPNLTCIMLTEDLGMSRIKFCVKLKKTFFETFRLFKEKHIVIIIDPIYKFTIGFIDSKTI